MADNIRLHLRVYGHVQGVNFRVLARQRARSLGLGGWIRNREDGSVEAVAEGDRAAVVQFRAWMEHGPSSARVDRVEAQEEPVRQRAPTFDVR